MPNTIHFDVTPVPNLQELHIKMRLTSIKKEQKFSMPVWVPGHYKRDDFSKYILAMAATADGKPIKLDQTSASEWLLPQDAEELEISYIYFCNKLTVESAYMDDEIFTTDSGAIFLRALDYNANYTISLNRPSGEKFNTWQCSTAMTPMDAELHQFGTFTAKDYEELIDHPILMGQLDIVTFDVNGVPHDLVLAGDHDADKHELARKLQLMCTAQMNTFHADAKQLFPRYMFNTIVSASGYGGLEHRASTNLQIPRKDLSTDTFMSLASHEYFHLWNVKRFKPVEFVPYDFTKESYTTLLWLSEGFTSYYMYLMLLRAQINDANTFLTNIAKTISGLKRTPGRFRQTLEQSSLEAWTKFYQRDENTPNTCISYYTKGALTGLIVDLSLRYKTDGRVTLDDVMRKLWQDFGLKNIGLKKGDFERVCMELSGSDLAPLFEHLLNSTDDFNFVELFKQFAIDCSFMQSAEQKAWWETEAWLGFNTITKSDPPEISTVYDNGPAKTSGLISGDKISKIDGKPPELKDGKLVTDSLLVGKPVIIEYTRKRDERLRTALVTPAFKPATECTLIPSLVADSAAIERRDKWLGL